MIRGRSFGQERIVLDGAHFVDCSFAGTTLLYFGGKIPELENCRLDGVIFTLEGPAKNTLRLVRQLEGQDIRFDLDSSDS